MAHSSDVDLVAGPSLRWSRAVILATVCLGSGSIAHRLANGLMPGPVAMLVLYLSCVVLAGALLGRPASALRIVILLMMGQTFIHGALTAMSGHRGDPPLKVVARVPTPLPMSALESRRPRVGSFYDQVYATRVGAGRTELVLPAPVQHILADLTGPHAAMAVAHLVAAGIVGLWLARGESCLWSVMVLMAGGAGKQVRLLLHVHGQLLTRLGLVAQVPAGLPATSRRPTLTPRRSLMLARRVSRRGPPLQLGFALLA